MQAGGHRFDPGTLHLALPSRGIGAIIPVDMNRLITIGTYTTRTEAEIVEGLLEAAGISASIQADDAGGAYPFEFSGGAQVLVDESDAEAASQLLAGKTEEA